MKIWMLAGVLATAVPASALTVQTSQFIFGGGTNYNGFEGLGSGVVPASYSEDGIDVTYVGDNNGIWTDSQPAAEGNYSWYPNGGGLGYTRFAFDDASGFQLLVASGWFGPDYTTLSWQVLLDGALVGTGSLDGFVAHYGGGWVYFGFSDDLFDEVRLQVRIQPGPFTTGVLEAGTYDAVTLTRAVPGGVPEPASWAMLIAGFGLVGGVARRRRLGAC